MTRETKVGLLIGLGVILLIGIIVSDHLSVASSQQGANLADFGPQAQRSIDPAPALGHRRLGAIPSYSAAASGPLPTIATPEELDAFPPAPEPLRLHPSPPLPPLQRALALESPAQEVKPAAPRAVIDPPAEAAVAVGSVAPRLAPSTRYHMVQPGQSLFEIARQYYGDGELWRLIASHNPGRVGPDGQVNQHVRLVIPSRSAASGSSRTTMRPRTVQRSTIVVQPGDTLTGLASKHLGHAARWNELLDANRDQLDRPEDLRPGMTLKLPTGESFTLSRVASGTLGAGSKHFYTVKAGDSLYRIAQQTLGDGQRWKEIREANRDTLLNPDALKTGQVLHLPDRN